MPIAVITSKGRITLPSVLRERFNLGKGDKLDFRIEEDGTVRVCFMTKRAAEVAGHFGHKATKARPVAAIKSGLRAAFRDRWVWSSVPHRATLEFRLESACLHLRNCFYPRHSA